jgi:hypothetical protein
MFLSMDRCLVEENVTYQRSTSQLHPESEFVVPGLGVEHRLVEFVADVFDPATVVAITDCSDLFVVEHIESRADKSELGTAELKGLAELEIQPVAFAGAATATGLVVAVAPGV